jgi:hypothetical protein
MPVEPCAARRRRSLTPSQAPSCGGASTRITSAPCPSIARSAAYSACAKPSGVAGRRWAACAGRQVGIVDQGDLAPGVHHAGERLRQRGRVLHRHRRVRRVMRFQRARGARRGTSGAAGIWSITAAIASALTWPGRSSTGPCVARRDRSTMVDSMPTCDAPPSSTMRHRPVGAEFVAHVLRRRRADVAELVGRGRRHPALPALEGAQQGNRHRMRGAAQADRVLAAADRIRNVRRALQDHRQRPGPEAPASACASGGISQAQCAMSASGARWTITGWSCGRPLAA